MTREEAIQWLKVISTRKFGWDEYAMQESQREIRERCEDCVREALRMAIEALTEERLYTHKEAWGMTDLIRREDAIAYIERVINSGLGRSKSLDYIHKYISALPSAEAVEVVRCKDCYHAEDDITHMFCVYFHHKVYEDDYCSNAVERREESEVEE